MTARRYHPSQSTVDQTGRSSEDNDYRGGPSGPEHERTAVPKLNGVPSIAHFRALETRVRLSDLIGSDAAERFAIEEEQARSEVRHRRQQRLLGGIRREATTGQGVV